MEKQTLQVYFRRLLALLFDFLIVTPLGLLNYYILNNNYELAITFNFIEITLIYFFIYTVITTLLTNGMTIGELLTKVKTMSANEDNNNLKFRLVIRVIIYNLYFWAITELDLIDMLIVLLPVLLLLFVKPFVEKKTIPLGLFYKNKSNSIKQITNTRDNHTVNDVISYRIIKLRGLTTGPRRI